jgi:hypothetical protein
VYCSPDIELAQAYANQALSVGGDSLRLVFVVRVRPQSYRQTTLQTGGQVSSLRGKEIYVVGNEQDVRPCAVMFAPLE